MSDLVRIKVQHNPKADDFGHEWITFGDRVKADSMGRLRPNLYFTSWTSWLCNNPDCGARALVSDQAVQSLIDVAPGGSVSGKP